jgi:hypothetical protein
VHLVCFIIRIYHDARSSECQRYAGNIINTQTQMPYATITVTKILRKNWTSKTMRPQFVPMHDIVLRKWSIDPLILDVSTRQRQWTSCLSCLSSLALPSNSPSTHWQKTGWVPLLLLELWNREKYFFPATHRTTVLSFQVQNVAAIDYTILVLQKQNI